MKLLQPPLIISTPPQPPTHTKLIPPNACDATTPSPSPSPLFASLLTPSHRQLLRRCSLSALSAAVWLRVCLPESELCSASATCPPSPCAPVPLCHCLLQVEAGNVNGRPITVGYSSDAFIYFGPGQTKLKFPLCSLRQILTAFK